VSLRKRALRNLIGEHLSKWWKMGSEPRVY